MLSDQSSCIYSIVYNMSYALLSRFGTIFNFTANVDVLENDCLEISELEFFNIIWTIKLWKGAGNALQFSISSDCGNNGTKWFCEASIILKIRHVENSEYFVEKVSRFKFSDEKPSYENEHLIDWHTFLNSYVKDKNEIFFEIEFIMNPPLKQTQSIDAFYTRFHVFFNDVNRSSYSPTTIVRGVQWLVGIEKTNENGIKKLAVYLHADEKDLDMNWSWPTEVTIKLLSFSNEVDPIQYHFTHHYRRGAPNLGCKLISWDDLIDSNMKYCYNNAINLEVTINVEQPKPIWDID